MFGDNQYFSRIRRYAQHSTRPELVLCVRISPAVVVSGVVVGIKSRRMKSTSTTNTANRGATAYDDRSPQLCGIACSTHTDEEKAQVG